MRTTGYTYVFDTTIHGVRELVTVQARVVTGNLEVGYTDVGDDDAKGDTTETLSYSLSRAVNAGSRIRACP